MDYINASDLPLQIREKLAELDLELSEGDITEKGYQKKKEKILQPYRSQKSGKGSSTASAQSNVDSSALHGNSRGGGDSRDGGRRDGRRYTRDESRYRSDIREEAVKEALARNRMNSRDQPVLLLPSKRREQHNPASGGGGNGGGVGGHGNNGASGGETAGAARARQIVEQDSETDDDDDDATSGGGGSVNDVTVAPSESGSNNRPLPSAPPPSGSGLDEEAGMHIIRGHVFNIPSNTLRRQYQKKTGSDQQPSSGGGLSSRITAGLRMSDRGRRGSNGGDGGSPSTEASGGPQRNKGAFGAPPDVTHNTGSNAPPPRRCGADVLLASSNLLPPGVASAIEDYAAHSAFSTVTQSTATSNTNPAAEENPQLISGNNSRVSDKILQLVNTLKRPKRRPLPEFFQEEVRDEVQPPAADPDAPKPKGQLIEPAIAEDIPTPSGLPRTLEAGLQRYATASGKSSVLTCLDSHAKPANTLTYAKLHQRSTRIAYILLNKLGHRGDQSLKPRDRVALVYTNNDPINFMCAFYGCLQAGVVPLAIEVPLMRRDASCQSMGFLLSSQDIRVVLTSEQCFKALPRNPNGEIVAFLGWPKVQWVNTDQQASGKPPKDWQPPERMKDEETTYIEYTYGKDGSIRGVMITRGAMLAHCRALTAACNYQEDDALVCVVDCKREMGLWHAVLTSVFNGMHVIFVPYSVMKVEPASWLKMVTKFKATTAIVKSRDMHWALLSEKDHPSADLTSLKTLLVADGSNPWSLTSCDSFLNKFRSQGLHNNAICPCAASPETLTLSLRRPMFTSSSCGSTTSPPSPSGESTGSGGRGVLSMQCLSCGVVRVDSENSLTSLTVQDCGRLLPSATAVVVKPTGQPFLCKTDEVGEICLASTYTGSGYWGLLGQTNSYFKVQPLYPDGQPLSESQLFTRSGFLGFLGPASSNGLIFVCGSVEGMMSVAGRNHNADDVIATVLAVEPMKIVYRGRIAVFSVPMLKDDRIVIVGEMRQGFSEETYFNWMSRVIHAIDSIHEVNVYCLALVLQNSLPKTPLGGIHVHETRRRFTEGSLHPCNVLLRPHSAITNLPQPREVRLGQVGPSAMMVGNLVAGARLAWAQGREIAADDDPENNKRHQFLSDILQWRATHTPNERLFTVVNQKMQESATMTCLQLHRKAEKIGSLLLEKGKIGPGAHVALIYPAGVELIAAVYGCLYAGCVPVPVKPPNPDNLETTLETARMIVRSSNAAVLLTNTPGSKLLKSKAAQQVIPLSEWRTILDTEESYRKRLTSIYKAMNADQELAYLDFSVSTTGVLAGVRMTHSTASALCHAQKMQCEFYPTREAVLCLEPYSGLGFVLWCLASVYCGHHSLLVPPLEMETAPWLWLSLTSQRKVRDTFCSYSAIELSTKGLAKEVVNMKAKGVSLATVRSLVIVAEERPRIQLTSSFTKLFSSIGLNQRSVSTSFGCRSCPAICLQGASSPDTQIVYVDISSLRSDRVKVLEKGSPNSLCLMESGKLLPGVRVVIANPETLGQCADSQMGEIWVAAPHNAAGYFAVVGGPVAAPAPDLSNEGGEGGEGTGSSGGNEAVPLGGRPEDHFTARLATGEMDIVYARTGYLGFVRRTDMTQSDGERHDALFVVGALQEAMMLRGMRYHPIDIENSILRCHKKIAECAVFSWSNLLVAVVELDGPDWEAMDLVHLVTSATLEEHYLIVGIVVVVDPASIPINSRGEKQRMLLRDAFINDKLDPICVSYNT